ncbi:MAG: DNA-3-methyladenine glycosylase [Oscillibacter sp.]|nr:DNA-3-methyladenine glycosylase [Oscillibacter sp.]
MARLSSDFYNGDTVEIARELLGKIVVRVLDPPPIPEYGPVTPAPLVLAGRVTETEAYIGRCDKACHAYGYRKTARTAPLFLGPGYAYIYLIYGMYHCLNFVTEPEGEPAAVLIRAVDAVSGADFMRRRRYGDRPMTPARIRGFLNGPGKVCQAFALTTAQNGLDLTGDTLFVCDSPADIGLDELPPRREIIRAGPRIGIDYAEEARDFPWRFTLTQNA